MSRDLPPELGDAIAEPVVRPFLAVRIELPDPVYAWTGQGTLTFGDSSGISRDWTGAGGVGAIDAIGESTDGSATGIKVSLFEIPSEFRDDIADQAVRGCLFEVYVGVLELGDNWHSVLATKLIWRGRLDDYKITDGGTSLSVEITGESRAIDQRRPSIKRFTDEYQQRKYPGDLFFQYVSQMAEIPIIWAQAEQSAVSGGVGGGGGGGGGGGAGQFNPLR
jgi:hypothetical protein